MLYGIGPDDRMFTVTKSYLYREMDRGTKEAGVPRIRIHDIRHSAVSLLIDMGFSATAIADRVGHESIDITYNYAHLFPTRQTEMANKLDLLRSNVQIPYDLFVDLELYHLNGEGDFEEDIRLGLEQKLDAMLNRQLYSQYKTAPTGEQREQARQEYLDRRGVPESYRWTTSPWER